MLTAGRAMPERDIMEAVDLKEKAPALAEQSLRRGADVVLIKCESTGIYLCSGDWERPSRISS